MSQPDRSSASTVPGPARVLVMATVVIPGDQAMPLDTFEAYLARALRDGGVHPVRVDAEFIEEAI